MSRRQGSFSKKWCFSPPLKMKGRDNGGGKGLGEVGWWKLSGGIIALLHISPAGVTNIGQTERVSDGVG